ncbi:gag/pol protein [Cucumis melo var. makuwa]|uniref:Gag/pol protein n=1 Tax=Cucumis melo var. makuwa TaxID=1194695 RepID=A0A5A7UFT7_CUCMM|nr:gag/pol protein [Cucumis melo var. makuwa]
MKLLMNQQGLLMKLVPHQELMKPPHQIVIPDDGVKDPLSSKQTMNDVDKDQWVKAMDLEMESMYFNSVWELVDLPEGVKPIGCKWIYKRKRDSAGKVQTFKAKLVAKWHGVHLSKEQCPKTPQEVEDMRHIPYASVVDSLMYYMLCTRPDICYAMEIVNKDSRKSTSGSVFTLNRGAVIWRSIKQEYIKDSTMKAEYVAACDNSVAVANSKELRSHKRGKHNERKYHLIREIMQ